MRITKQQQQIIKKMVARVFGSDASVLLFGSRTHDKMRGGDIDLLIILKHPTNNTLQKNLELNATLQLAMGGIQKIDIITYISGTKKNSVQKEALETGIRL